EGELTGGRFTLEQLDSLRKHRLRPARLAAEPKAGREPDHRLSCAPQISLRLEGGDRLARGAFRFREAAFQVEHLGGLRQHPRSLWVAGGEQLESTLVVLLCPRHVEVESAVARHDEEAARGAGKFPCLDFCA